MKMKFTNLVSLKKFAGAFLLLTTLCQGEDLTAVNLSIQASAAFGQVQTGTISQSTTAAGFSVSVVQGTSEITVPYTVDGHYEEGLITIEDYGYNTISSLVPQYSYQQIGTNYVPPVYDNEGNLIEPGREEPVYGDVYVGEHWQESQVWGVVGTHTELGQIWVPPYESFYTDNEYNAPKIQFTASRSDANWAWQVPTSTSGEVRDIMILWNGGLRLPSEDPNRMMSLSSDSLTHSYDEANDSGRYINFTRLGSHSLKASAAIVRGSGATAEIDESISEMKPEAVILTYRKKQGEQDAVVNSSAQTQISAASAHFAGLVTVAGDVKVQGVLRVMPAGNLSMGNFTDGPKPTGGE